ncbi:MAG: lytic murein transglycosylase [Rhizobiales bacterium]|nr:lytic murein transglycosylase [Hyphomicrobiales bacterium]
MKFVRLFAAFLALTVLAPAAHALKCSSSPAGFGKWLTEFKAVAKQNGISARALGQLDGLTYATAVIRADRNQKHFKQSFEQFSKRMISGGRISKGRALLAKHAKALARIEASYGVPPEVIIAIWGLETDYGVNMGKLPVLRSVATLAYDCRRTERFQNELMSALLIIERGDMSASELKGAWAGEIGQAQFMASSYINFAVDGDGNGRINLIRSQLDVMASIASYLRGHGWREGAGYAPGQPNFRVIASWNKATVYQKTIAAFARRLEGG